MLSRIADCLYWMSRYLERADNTSRLIEINLLHLVEAEDVLPETAQWKPLLSIAGNEETYGRLYPGAEINAQRVIHFLTQESSNPNAIYQCLRTARENARIVRDRISKEMWESLNELWLQVDSQLKNVFAPDRPQDFYVTLRKNLARFHGLTANTMMRGEAFGFYQLGTFLERADMTARILDVKYHLLLPDLSLVGSPIDYYQWAALLKSLSGFEAYRRKYHAGFRPIDVAGFVIFERDFPRSLRFSLERMHQAIQEIGNKGRYTYAVMSRLMEELEHQSSRSVFFEEGLHEFLKNFLGHISDLNGALMRDFFESYLGENACAT
jgi:uncharacterized alpha-E superfamily protein